MLLFLALFLALYAGVNYYVGRRAWQWLRSIASRPLSRLLYWSTFWLLALAYFLARFVSAWLPMVLADLLMYIGGYWMAMLVYAVPLLLLIDLVRLANRWIRFAPRINLLKYAGATAFLLIAGLLLYGTWRARTPVVTAYNLSIPKSAGPHKELDVVLVSDTHLGYMLGKGRIQEMVELVNGLEPDLILVAGDIVDDDFRPVVTQGMAAELSQLRSRLGTYGVLGNHDDGSEDLPAFRAEMERAGIHLLVDEWVKVDESLIIAGRNDSSQARSSGGAVPLAAVLQGADPSVPLLLMDHQPNRLADSVAAGVDLQVSGHTHRGQLFPFNLITERVFEVDWGYLQKGATQFVVSSGFGTWGPPVRIGNRPEVVRIHLTFGA